VDREYTGGRDRIGDFPQAVAEQGNGWLDLAFIGVARVFGVENGRRAGLSGGVARI
jgi:hypothetical protein